MLQAEGLFSDLISQWEKEFPGEDSSPIAIAMRLRHLYALDQASLEEVLVGFDIGVGEVDVLTHLGHQSPPYRLRPSDLAELCMVTTGAITGRITRLESKGFVERVPSQTDKRTIFVQMTETGEKVLRETRTQVTKTSRFLNGIRGLPPTERDRLNRLLAKLIQVF